MFRPTALRPSGFATPLRRLSLRAQTQCVRYASDVSVQRVRFVKRSFTWKQAAAFGLYTGAFLFYWRIVLKAIDQIDDPEDDTAEEVEADEEDEEEYEEEYDEDAIFIPMGFPKPRPRTFYKGSDPEWQEFRRVAQDPNRANKMRQQLVSIIRGQVANDPRMLKRFGQINVATGRYWLDITFPDGPPLEYERRGVEITSDHITWSKRPMNQTNYWRLQRALWPSAAFSSLYASSQYIFRLQVQKAREWLGLSSGLDSKQEVLRSLEAFNRSVRSTSGSQANMTGKPAEANERSADGAAPTNSKGTQKGVVASLTGPKGKNGALPDFTPPPPESMAFHIFAHTMQHKWKPLNIEAPRGTVVVSGMVEVLGNKARCTLDVAAAYDPKSDKYVVVRMGLRRVQERVQRPRGGR